MASLKTFFLPLLTVTLYTFWLYKIIAKPVHKDLLEAYIESLENQKIKIEADVEKMIYELLDKVFQNDEIQAFIANLTLSITDLIIQKMKVDFEVEKLVYEIFLEDESG